MGPIFDQSTMSQSIDLNSLADEEVVIHPILNSGCARVGSCL
jgi:hypothetical protein